MPVSKSKLVPHLAAILVTGLLLTGTLPVCRADDAADAKETAVSFAQAIAKMDAPAARTFLSDAAAAGEEGKFVDTITAAIVARRKFQQAAAAKFGAATPNAPAQDPVHQMVEKIRQASVSIVGGVATVSRPHDPTPLTLEKIGGAWKVTHVAPLEKLHEQLPLIQTLANAQETTAQEITDGKYQSLDAAKQAVREKVAAAAAANAPATTGPASAPAH